MTFPSDRHPDYYEGARHGAEALRLAILDRPPHVRADFAPDYCLIHVAATINTAEQAMRAAEERALAPQEPTTPGARFPLAIVASVPFPPEMHRDATEYVREAMVRAGEEACNYLRRRAERPASELFPDPAHVAELERERAAEAEPVEADPAEMDRLAARFPQGDGEAVEAALDIILTAAERQAFALAASEAESALCRVTFGTPAYNLLTKARSVLLSVADIGREALEAIP